MAFLLFLSVILYTNWIVHKYAKDKTFSSLDKIEHRKVGLLLGTSKYSKKGGLNDYFKHRIAAATQLFKAHKIDYILVSGDNAHISYNEPRDFKKALMKRGVPEDKIILDFAGFHTLDSVIRAKKVFGQEEIIIISQKLHNERAIYLAEKNGLRAIGFNAKTPDHNPKFKFREYMARVKAYFDVIFNMQPRFLGDPEIIKEPTDENT